jgi:hypothetical protein
MPETRTTFTGALVELGQRTEARATLVGALLELDHGREAVIRAQIEVDWDGDGVYADETARFILARGEHRLTNPADPVSGAARGIIDRCTLLLHNPDGRYSPLNTSSPLAGHIADGGAYHKDVRINVSTDNGSTYTTLFRGVIKWPAEQIATSQLGPAVEFECRSRDELLLQQRISSLQADLARARAEGWSADRHIAAWLEDAGFVDGVDFVSQSYAAANGVSATLDRDILAVPWVWVDDASVLEAIWQLAAACGGSFYADHTAEGRFRYENAAHWLRNPHDTSQATLDKDAYVNVRPLYDDRELYREVRVDFTARSVGRPAVIWRQTAAVVVPAGETVRVLARLDAPAAVVETPVAGVDFAAVSPAGADLSGSIGVGVTAYAQRVELTFTNHHAGAAANLTNLQLRGQLGEPVAGGVSAASGAPFWTSRTGRTRAVTNPAVQSPAQAAFLASLLIDRQEDPRLLWRVEGVRGVPGRRLGDRVTVRDPATMSSGREGFITGLYWTLGRLGFRQDYDVIDASGLYAYDDYFIIGQHKLGAPGSSSEPGRVFY